MAAQIEPLVFVDAAENRGGAQRTPVPQIGAEQILAARLGFWSALAAAVFAVIFLFGVALSALLPPLWAMALTVVPALLLNPALLTLVVCMGAFAPVERRPLALLALACASIYVAIISANYFLQLTTVRHLSSGPSYEDC
jgi:hypothetical protein